MAANHIYFNPLSQYGSKLRGLLSTLESGDDQFADVRDVMIQMRDGDGSQAVHYALVTARFGFETDAGAKAAFEELDSAYSKTSGNGTVDNTRAARDQLFAKLR